MLHEKLGAPLAGSTIPRLYGIKRLKQQLNPAVAFQRAQSNKLRAGSHYDPESRVRKNFSQVHGKQKALLKVSNYCPTRIRPFDHPPRPKVFATVAQPGSPVVDKPAVNQVAITKWVMNH